MNDFMGNVWSRGSHQEQEHNLLLHTAAAPEATERDRTLT
jgi:hypothetical protein